MKFVPTSVGEMIRVDDIERLVPQKPKADATEATPKIWGCQTRDGRTHRLKAETVDLLSATLVPCSPGWFVPEELVRGSEEHLVGVSKVPIVAWMIHGDGARISPITVDPDLAATGHAVGSPDGRVFLKDGAEFESLEEYLKHLRSTRGVHG